MHKYFVILFFTIGSVFSQNRTDSEIKNKSFLYEDFLISKSISQNISIVDKSPKYYQPLDYENLAIAGGITLGVGLGVHYYQASAWWQDQSAEFHIVNDWTYARNIDKFGHFFATQLLAHGFSSFLESTNLTAEQNAIFSSSMALLFELYVEIEDGYGPNWGFSPGDATFDFIGASYFLAQYYFPILKSFQPRVSYWPTQKVLNGKTNAIIIDDYEGQTFWIGIKIEDLLSKKYSDFWPDFLMLSVGTAARGLDGRGNGINEFYLALDLDPQKLPLYGKYWEFVKNTLNYVHFPMPGLKISPDFAGFAIVF